MFSLCVGDVMPKPKPPAYLFCAILSITVKSGTGDNNPSGEFCPFVVVYELRDLFGNQVPGEVVQQLSLPEPFHDAIVDCGIETSKKPSDMAPAKFAPEWPSVMVLVMEDGRREWTPKEIIQKDELGKKMAELYQVSK
jgi:hypothetical protein